MIICYLNLWNIDILFLINYKGNIKFKQINLSVRIGKSFLICCHKCDSSLWPLVIISLIFIHLFSLDSLHSYMYPWRSLRFIANDTVLFSWVPLCSVRQLWSYFGMNPLVLCVVCLLTSGISQFSLFYHCRLAENISKWTSCWTCVFAVLSVERRCDPWPEWQYLNTTILMCSIKLPLGTSLYILSSTVTWLAISRQLLIFSNLYF